MSTPKVNYLGPAHPHHETEFYVLPPTREGENPLGLIELLRALKSGELPAGSESATTDSSTQRPELETETTDHPSQQSGEPF